MQDVVVEAVNRLINIGTPVRIAAEFAEENNGTITLNALDK